MHEKDRRKELSIGSDRLSSCSSAEEVNRNKRMMRWHSAPQRSSFACRSSPVRKESLSRRLSLLS
jgi:hypothetical protein